MNYILDFRKCILLLANTFQRNEFDLESVASHFQRLEVMISLASQMSPIPTLEVVKARVRPRLLTNDLRKLYLMGLLRRRKERRTVTGKSGRRYRSGVRFRYSLSRQGISYVGYLVNSKRSIGMQWKDLGELAIFATIQKEAPEHAQDAVWQLHRKWNRTKGERRFPHRENIFDYGMKSFDPKLKAQILKSETISASIKFTPGLSKVASEDPLIEKVIRVRAAEGGGVPGPLGPIYSELDAPGGSASRSSSHSARSPEAAEAAREAQALLDQLRSEVAESAKKESQQSKPSSYAMKKELESEGCVVEYPPPLWAVMEDALKKTQEGIKKHREEAAAKQKSDDDFVETLELFQPLLMAFAEEFGERLAKAILKKKAEAGTKSEDTKNLGKSKFRPMEP